MNDSFNRAPGAGRVRGPAAEPGFVGTAGDPSTSTSTSTAFYNQMVSPLRQPRTSPSFTESPNIDPAGDGRKTRHKSKHQRANLNPGGFFVSFIDLAAERVSVERCLCPRISTRPP